MTEKKCSICGEVKSADHYYIVRKTGKLRPACRSCTKTIQKVAIAKASNPVSVAEKECVHCGVSRPASRFGKEPRSRDGLKSFCNVCTAATKSVRIERRGYLKRTEKRCTCCKTILPAAEFHGCRSSEDGLDGRCRSCCSRGQQGPLLCVVCRCLKPRDSFRRHLKSRYRSECRECEQIVVRCSKCKTLKSRDQFSPDKVLETGLKSTCRQCDYEYTQTPEGQVVRTAAKHRRRTRMKGRICTLTGEEWRQILEAYDHSCAYCRKPFGPDRKATQDHFLPVSKGGHHTKDNIVPACGKCNSSKHNSILGEKPLPLSRR